MQVQALRLKTYFFHKAQKEDLPLENDLYPFYYIAIPFVDAVKRFYEALKKKKQIAKNTSSHLVFLTTPFFAKVALPEDY